MLNKTAVLNNSAVYVDEKNKRFSKWLVNTGLVGWHGAIIWK